MPLTSLMSDLICLFCHLQHDTQHHIRNHGSVAEQSVMEDNTENNCLWKVTLKYIVCSAI